MDSAFNGQASSGAPIDLIRTIRRHKLGVIATIFIISSAVIGLSSLIVSRFDATAAVMIENKPGNLRELQANSYETQVDPSLVGTELEILRSPEIARRVVTKLGLDTVPEFSHVGLSIPALLNSALAHITKFRLDTGPVSGTPESRATDRLQRQVSFLNSAKSYVIFIHAESQNAETSAAIANTYADTYFAFRREVKSGAITHANMIIGRHLAQLKAKAMSDAQAVDAFRSTNDLTAIQTGVQADSRVTIADQQLAAVNAQLVAASNLRSEREANLASTIKLVATGQIDTAPQVLASPLIQRLREQESELANRAAGLEDRMGGQMLTSIHAQLSQVRRKIADEINKIVKSQTTELAMARATEADLAASLNSLRVQVIGQSAALTRLKALEAEAATSRTLYDDFLTQSERTATSVDMQLADADLVSRASPATVPSYPNRILIAVVALAGSIVASVFVALGLERAEIGFRSGEEFEAATGERLLGLLPKLSARALRNLKAGQEEPMYSEALNFVRSRLGWGYGGERGQVFLVTSSVPGEGKTTFAVGFAAAFARAGVRTLLIDCDLRRSAVATALSLQGPGLNLLLTSGADPVGHNSLIPKSQFRDGVIRKMDGGLDVIPTFPGISDPQSISTTKQVQQIIEEARSLYDVIILDSPPVLTVGDALLLARTADETIFVTRWRKTPRLVVSEGLRSLRLAGAKMAGAVMTQVNTRKYAGWDLGTQSYLYRSYKSLYE